MRVARFAELWDELASLGEVLDERIRAEDVTDQHIAHTLRRAVLVATRDRLVALLARSTSETEKLRLLAEITRVTEELDLLETRLRTLADLAAMSRITVEVVPEEAFVAQEPGREPVGMEWLRSLSPFVHGPLSDHRLAFAVPEQMVALSDKGPFVAESPGGTVWWATHLDNEPEGSTEFWIRTLQDRLENEFASAQRSEHGDWACLALDEPSKEERYRWEICVVAQGKRLSLSQVYYPDPEQYSRYGAAIEASLASQVLRRNPQRCGLSRPPAPWICDASGGNRIAGPDEGAVRGPIFGASRNTSGGNRIAGPDEGAVRGPIFGASGHARGERRREAEVPSDLVSVGLPRERS